MSASYSRRRRRSDIKKSTRAVNTSQAKGQKSRIRAPRRRARGAAIKTVYRTSRVLRPDMRVRYAHEVAERSVDRAAWAEVVLQLMAQETGTPAKPKGNKSRFAELVGVTYKTVLRWINKEVDVSEESVRQVARKLGMNPMDLLVRVGYYEPADIQPTPGPTPEEIAADPALRVIEESGHPPSVKARMRQRLYELRAKRAAEEVDEVKWWLDHARGA